MDPCEQVAVPALCHWVHINKNLFDFHMVADKAEVE